MKINFEKICSVTDNFILTQKLNKKIINSQNPWNIFICLFIVLGVSFLFALNVYFFKYNYLYFVFNSPGNSNLNLTVLYKVFFTLPFLWFLGTVIATYFNKSVWTFKEMFENIAHILTLPYLLVFPFAFIGLFIKSFLGNFTFIYYDFIILIFTLYFIGSFFWAGSEKSNKPKDLEFVYTKRKLDPAKLYSSIVGNVFIILCFTVYFSYFSEIKSLINFNPYIRPVFIIVFYGFLLIVPTYILGLYRQSKKTNKNSFIVSFYVYCKPLIYFLVSLFVLDLIFYRILHNDNYVNDIFFSYLFLVSIFIYFIALIYETNLLISENGYGFDNINSDEDILLSGPKAKYISSFFKFFVFDSIIGKDETISKDNLIKLILFDILGIGLLGAEGHFFLFKGSTFTGIFWVDFLIAVLWAVVLVGLLSVVWRVYNRRFIGFVNILSPVLFSLITLSILGFLSVFMGNNKNLICSNFAWVFLFWAAIYMFLYYFTNGLRGKKLLWSVSFYIISGLIIFFLVSIVASSLNIYIYKNKAVTLGKVIKVNKEIDDQIYTPLPIDFDESDIMPVYSIDLGVTTFGDYLEHRRHFQNMGIYSPPPIRIGYEISLNHNWAKFLYSKTPRKIRKINDPKEKTKALYEYVVTNIKEEETTYPFGENMLSDPITTYKRKAGNKAEIAILLTAYLLTNGIDANYSQKVTPDQFFNDSYTLVRIKTSSEEEEIYPKNLKVGSNKEDLSEFAGFLKKHIKDTIGLYYVKNGDLYPYNYGRKHEEIMVRENLLPGKYMCAYKTGNRIESFQFIIRKQ